MSAATDPVWVAAACFKEIVQIWDVNRQTELTQFHAVFCAGARNLAISPSGRIVVTAVSKVRGVVAAYDVETGEQLWVREGIRFPRSLSFDSGGQYVRLTVNNSSVHYLEARTGSRVKCKENVTDVFESQFGGELVVPAGTRTQNLLFISEAGSLEFTSLGSPVLDVAFSAHSLCLTQVRAPVRCIEVLDGGRERWRYAPADSHIQTLHYSRIEEVFYGVSFSFMKGVGKTLLRFDPVSGRPDEAAVDANSHGISLDYTDRYWDGVGRNTYAFPTTVTDANGNAGQQWFDYNTGQPKQVKDVNGNSTTYTYIQSGLGLDTTAQVTLPNGSHAGVTYPDTKTVKRTQDKDSAGDGVLTTESLLSDTNGHAETQTRTFESATSYITTETIYDASGRVSQQSNPYRSGDTEVYTTYNYDSIGRILSTVLPDGTTANGPNFAIAAPSGTNYTGPAVTVTDQAGHKKVTQSDAIGRLRAVVEYPVDGSSATYVTTYTYGGTAVTGNAVPSPQMVVNQSSQTRGFVWDLHGRLISATNPESATVTYGYDAADNLTSKTDARGITTTIHYDNLNRPSSKTFSDSTPGVSISYDPAIANGIGQINTVSRNGNSFAYTGYDAMGNVTGSSQTTNGQTYSFAYGYDLAGDLTSETFPSGRTVKTSYDSAGRPYTLTGTLAGTATTYVSSMAYAAQGSTTSRVQGNNIVTGTSYNSRLQTASTWADVGNSTANYLYKQNYDWAGAAGNNGRTLYKITEETGNSVPESSLTSWTLQFSYDGVNRLTSVSDTGGWSRSFNYDAFGNVWIPSAGGITPEGDAPTNSGAYSNGYNRTNGVSYDAVGNQLNGLGGNAATYDAENRMITLAEPASAGGNAIQFTYDGLGQRVMRSLNSGAASTVYVYDAVGRLAAEYSTSPQAPSCTTCYLTQDHLGSVRLVTDSKGSIVSRHDYLPFGEEIGAGVASRNSVAGNGAWGPQNETDAKFTGQLRDDNAGLDYFNARYYSPGLGRFSSPDPGNAAADPTDPQTWNAYAYVNNNPLSNVDPTGMAWTQAQVQVCTPVTTSTISYEGETPSPGSGPALKTACHYETQFVWVNDPDSDPSGSNGGGAGGAGGGGAVGAGNKAPQKNGTPDKPIDWHKIGSCLVSSTLNHYGLTAAAGASGLLAIPISKALVPPYRVIGTPTTNLLSVLGHYAEITVPRMLESTNLLRIAGRANPYVAGALLAIDVGMISYDTYQCYQQATPSAPSAPAPQPATGPGGPG